MYDLGMMHHRRSIRLQGYDYTQEGAYFVTIVTAGRVARFGTIRDDDIELNPVGQMILREWQRLPSRFPSLTVEPFAIMPNHIHGILMICPPPEGITSFVDSAVSVRVECLEPKHMNPRSLGEIVRAFKSSTTLRFHHMRCADRDPLWQRNYYEHIVRGSGDLEIIYAYIEGNSVR